MNTRILYSTDVYKKKFSRHKSVAWTQRLNRSHFFINTNVVHIIQLAEGGGG